MPRIKHQYEEAALRKHPGLVKRLAQELTSAKEFGQPWIEEKQFADGSLRVTVLWDKWKDVSDPERAEVILKAYEDVEGKAYRDRIKLPIALTYPEAHEIGLLPFKLEFSLREGEAPSRRECFEAMIEEGASRLFSHGKPELRFATEREMEAARDRLRERFPSNPDIWRATKELSPSDL